MSDTLQTPESKGARGRESREAEAGQPLLQTQAVGAPAGPRARGGGGRGSFGRRSEKNAGVAGLARQVIWRRRAADLEDKRGKFKGGQRTSSVCRRLSEAAGPTQKEGPRVHSLQRVFPLDLLLLPGRQKQGASPGRGRCAKVRGRRYVKLVWST